MKRFFNLLSFEINSALCWNINKKIFLIQPRNYHSSLIIHTCWSYLWKVDYIKMTYGLILPCSLYYNIFITQKSGMSWVKYDVLLHCVVQEYSCLKNETTQTFSRWKYEKCNNLLLLFWLNCQQNSFDFIEFHA